VANDGNYTMSNPTPNILLSNDDSFDSPILHITLEILKDFGNLYVAVPDEEQSWKGKSMTRLNSIVASPLKLEGATGWKINGTPADCTNLAMHQLMPSMPDIVISGTNIGKNVGAGFIFSSGTIGACLEANISGIPAIALSQELAQEDFMYWHENRSFRPETILRLKRTLGKSIPEIWQKFPLDSIDPRTTWNINFPEMSFSDPEIIYTKAGQSYYGNCFSESEKGYKFSLKEATIDKTPLTDDKTLKDGNISATLLDLRTFGGQITKI
jgi:5'-nucleotidase